MAAITTPPAFPPIGSATFNADAYAWAMYMAGTLTPELNAFLAAVQALAAGGAVSLKYTFSTTTTDADPGTGILRLDNATQNAATIIRVDLTDNAGSDMTNVLALLDDSTSTNKGMLTLRHTTDATKWLTFKVASMASPAGYRNVTVTNPVGSAASPFTNGDSILLDFTATGDKGDTGTPGTLSGNASGAINYARATVASHATTADIWAAAGNQIDWTGTATTTIFPNAPQAGAERVLICAGACSFTAGANMLIVGVGSGSTVTCAANDQVDVFAISTTQFLLTRKKYDGTAQIGTTILADYLIVGGGGPGGGSSTGDWGDGGGGGGGWIEATGESIVKGLTYGVVVGAGGAASNTNSVAGTNGSPSSFNNFTALGGGYGALTGVLANSGSSGGGASSASANTPGTGFAGQGYVGGGASYPRSGGGGGGQSAAGADADGGGVGGAGRTSTITGSVYGGGGGGGCRNDRGAGTGAAGGNGGGGKGGGTSAAVAGTANTGGGGGGAGYTGAAITPAKNGGSGVVVIRYADTEAAATTTGSPGIVVSGGYRTYTYTSSGTFKV